VGKFISPPCEKAKEFLRSKNIQFVEEYQPLLHKDRFYSIDIAFPERKIGIEINGNQHYERDGTLTSYYQTRHNLIEAEGWTLYELPFQICYDLEKFGGMMNNILSTNKNASIP